MPYRFSPSTGCFYPDDVAYTSVPIDAIAVSNDEFDAAMAAGPQDTLAVVNGALVIQPYAGPTLAEAKANQIAVINNAFQAAILAPVSFTIASGTIASFSQNHQAKTNIARCIQAGAQAWTANVWLDAGNNPVSPFTFADLQGLDAAIEAADAPAYQDLLAKIAAIGAATSVAAVEAITF